MAAEFAIGLERGLPIIERLKDLGAVAVQGVQTVLDRLSWDTDNGVMLKNDDEPVPDLERPDPRTSENGDAIARTPKCCNGGGCAVCRPRT